MRRGEPPPSLEGIAPHVNKAAEVTGDIVVCRLVDKLAMLE